MKTCPSCQEEKELSEFHRHKARGFIDGMRYAAYCKVCERAKKRKLYWDDKAGRITRTREKNSPEQNKQLAANRKRKEREEYPKKQKARWMVKAALKSGKLKKLCCSTCGEKQVEAHHPDYNAPLEVIWFCKRHHAEWHRNNVAIY